MTETKRKEKMKKIILEVGIPIFFVFSYFLYAFRKDAISMGINIAAVILFNLVLIPVVFYGILSDPKQSEKEIKYYIIFHVIYVLFPAVLAGQIVLGRQVEKIDLILRMAVITQVISICNLIILYFRCKKLIKEHLIKRQIKYLRYSNKLISGVFLFVITLVCMYENSLNTVFFFLFSLPLVGLKILYEKIDILVEEEKERT